MRIGIYNPRVGTAKSGGTETFLREMMKRLSREHEVVCYTGTGKILDEVASLDVDIVQIPFLSKEDSWNRRITDLTPLLPAEIESLSLYWSALRRGVLDSMSSTVDVVSTHYYLDNVLLSRSTDVPSVFRFPGIRHPSWRWKLMARTANPTVYLGNSQSTAERVERWLNITVDGVVYPGVDVDQFSPDIGPDDKSDSLSILYVGRLDEGKGLFDLLEAHARLTPIPELRLVGDGKLVEDLEAYTDRLGTSSQVTFAGPIPHGDVHRQYAMADIFCLPSEHESLGIVNLEAMATGLPVVSTRIDAIEEYIADGENGLLVEPGNVDELASALQRFVSSPSIREEIGEKGRMTAQSFSWEDQAIKLVDYYEQAIN